MTESQPTGEYKPTDLRDMSLATFHAEALAWTHVVECNVCHHAITKLGSDWVCAEGCKCLMIGCVPSKKQD